MSGHVLIVDSVAARRSQMAATLSAARYAVAESAGHPLADQRSLGAVGREMPDLIVVDLGEGAPMPAGAMVARLRQWTMERQGHASPVLALAPPGRGDLRLAAIEAGAEVAMTRSATSRILQARIRSLIRARDTERDLRFRDEAEGLGLATGLAETAASFLGAVREEPLRVTLLAAEPGDGLAAALPGRVAAGLGRDVVLTRASADVLSGAPAQDLYLIDALGLVADPGSSCEALDLLVELLSRPSSRGTATVLLLPATAVETAALALDLGAADVILGPDSPAEASARIASVLRRKAETDRLRDRIRTHLQAAVRDPLTGLHNRRYAEPALVRMADRSRRTGRPMAVLILDIDHFKAVNDRHGHATGDRVLAEVASRLRGWIRDDDLVARIGGEEFLIALADTGPAEARALADALRARIGARPFRTGPPACELGEPSCADVRVTVSVGVAAAAGVQLASLSVADLLDRADGALYAAKGAGRDTVSLALGAA